MCFAVDLVDYIYDICGKDNGVVNFCGIKGALSLVFCYLKSVERRAASTICQ